MNIDINNLRESILKSIDEVPFIESDDIPNILLYMDQVTTFMDQYLKGTTRFPDTDKILTKTMINNYAKNDLLPPPDKKKYSKEHVLVMLYIYYFKNVLSINDISMLLSPLTEKYFGKNSGTRIADIYNAVSVAEKSQLDTIKKDLDSQIKIAKSQAESLPNTDDDFAELFILLSMLNHDIFIKKQIMEKALDDYARKHQPAEPEPKVKKKEKKARK